MKKVFFSQRLLDSLSEEGKIKLEGNVLSLLSDASKTFELEPAFRILQTADGSEDPHNLVGRIMSKQELEDMRAEAYMDSLIYKDTAYTADSGFIGEEKDVMEKMTDNDILARFLLENLI